MLFESQVLSRVAVGLASARSVTVPCSVTPAEFLHAVGRPAGFFAAPDGFEMAGVGTAWTGRDFHVLGLDDARAFVGFAFDQRVPPRGEWLGFPSATVVLPEIAVIRDAAGTRVTVVVPPDGTAERTLRLLGSLEAIAAPGSAAGVVTADEPDSSVWRQNVGAVLDRIDAGAVSKVVLARSKIVDGPAPFDPVGLVDALRRRHRSSYIYAWMTEEASFVGASPELLVAVDGLEVSSRPMAGSIGRGGDEAADDAMADALLSSKKDRFEHRLVVEAVQSALELVTDRLTVEGPKPIRVANIQHLATELRGTLTRSLSVLDLVAVLHPTPAVAGTPTIAALETIRELEPFDRGWYAGGFGWMDLRGSGAVTVALRCALFTGTRARLYAGAGIVEGSDPDSELAETDAKFSAVLDLLT